MAYSDAIAWWYPIRSRRRRGNTIKDAGGEPVMVPHTIGDDIPEVAARQMTDIIGQPIFLYGFLTALGSFICRKCRGRKERLGFVHREWRFAHAELNVGEIMSELMRIANGPKLLGAYGREGIDPEPCWCTDNPGTCQHGWTRSRHTASPCVDRKEIQCSMYQTTPQISTFIHLLIYLRKHAEYQYRLGFSRSHLLSEQLAISDGARGSRHILLPLVGQL
ncbi:hypothetical protein EDC04DRAFT_1165058 [Pisolithus marmoratus]|nr:hypothetical protein EDC04DRAFT_1165058 [Pisolithus marmoratus]